MATSLEKKLANPMMSSLQVGEYLGVSAKTLRNWRQKGKGPPWIRLEGGGVRYRPDDLERWLEELAEVES